MINSHRYLAIHGHFYQPPRENPWLGAVETQHSSYPWPDWNERIAAECYLPMARSRLLRDSGEICDLYNNYAHMSFNFGPSLLSWAEREHPKLLSYLAEAAGLHNNCAMAQAWSHSILPLDDAESRHLQIVWGLREFSRRFGCHADGFWLPECAIDGNTVRALIDHKVKFVILSPHQASQVRPFGEQQWQDVSMGAIDTRRAYRLFDTDGAGRTHFDRYLDVVFYTPGLNLKISFDHALHNPDLLRKELADCYDPAVPGPQIATIVTDGEIYGHHEKGGEEALTMLFAELIPECGLQTCTIKEFLDQNPPSWEVKLWAGPDGRGSSWSCQHGVGRWFSDCGCRFSSAGEAGQGWRAVLRDAFDLVRDRIRDITRRELGGMLRDVSEAKVDFIDVAMTPSAGERKKFLLRNAQRDLNLADERTLWRLLEAERQVLCMYASCGWYFDDISGLESTQVMRHALRAIELAQPYGDEDLEDMLRAELRKAKSNANADETGEDVLDTMAATARYRVDDIVAGIVMMRAIGFPSQVCDYHVVAESPVEWYAADDGALLSWGAYAVRDNRLCEDIIASWLVCVGGPDQSGVLFHQIDFNSSTLADKLTGGDGRFNLNAVKGDMRQWVREVAAMSPERRTEAIVNNGVSVKTMPTFARECFCRNQMAAQEDSLARAAADTGKEAAAFLSRAVGHHDLPGAVLRQSAEAYFLMCLKDKLVRSVTGDRQDLEAAANDIRTIFTSASSMGIALDPEPARQCLSAILRGVLRVLTRGANTEAIGSGRRSLAAERPWSMWMAWIPRLDRQALEAWLENIVSDTLSMADDPEAGWIRALIDLPLPELLCFARQAGLPPMREMGLAADFWNYLDKPFGEWCRKQGDLASRELTDRLREIGIELGFACDVLDKRLAIATGVF